MGQKINPVSLRLQYTNRYFDNCWYSHYFYKDLITKDISLQNYLNNFLKLLKLPAGRYSIQHLQKKTQVYSFFCYSKPMREWRAKLFGLTKKTIPQKKFRYFLKNKIESRKKTRKQNKLSFFYKTLNQLTVHKIQKKITSFQNFQLWSSLSRKKRLTTKNFILISAFNSNSNETSQNLSKNKSFSFPVHNYLFNISNNQKQLEMVQKINQSNRETNYFQKVKFFTEKPVNNVNLYFLQNLFLYKTIKSQIKPQNLLENTRKFSLGGNLQTPMTFSLLDLKQKTYLESFLSSFFKLQVNLQPFKVKNDWQHASYLADEIVYFLERRIPFRRLKNRILQQLAKNSIIRGVRITCSGRVGGKSKKAQRAKVECIKYGQTSLQVFSSQIDFSVKTAFTSFGSVGVKVWICYN